MSESPTRTLLFRNANRAPTTNPRQWIHVHTLSEMPAGSVLTSLCWRCVTQVSLFADPLARYWLVRNYGRPSQDMNRPHIFQWRAITVALIEIRIEHGFVTETPQFEKNRITRPLCLRVSYGAVSQNDRHVGHSLSKGVEMLVRVI